MKRIWIGILSLVFMYGCTSLSSTNHALPDGITLIEQVDAEPGKAMIPYSKYRLDNGLTVILTPDTSDPLVHVDVTYHVGSAREEIGKSGFAHFFEHMMFQGSEHVGDQQHFKIVTEAGGSLNGSTTRDRTNYYQTVPANQLEKVLWLEADRMGFLVGAVSQRKFEIQRDTVKNERAQNYDNRPYGLMWERIGEAMYPEGHPYSWQPIGYVEDLDRVNVNDLKAFFLRWYGPNNAVLTIGGDIDKQQTLQWISQYFSTIPKGPEVDFAPKQPAVLTEDRYITLEDRIRQPMVIIGWPTDLYRGAQGQVALDAMADAIGGGTNSILYQQLVKTQKALDAGAFADCSELACNFYLYAMGSSTDKEGLRELNDHLLDALEDFSQQGISQEKLDQIIGSSETSAVFALQSVRGKVSQLASNETFFNTPDRLQPQLERIRALTPQAVMAQYQKYIEGKPTLTLSVVPKGSSDIAVHPATFVTPARTLPDYKTMTESDLVLRRAVDNFDRSVMPEVAEAVEAKIPELYRLNFANGSQLLGTVSTETPTVEMHFRLPAGERYVAKGKEGLAGLTAAMMEEGTTSATVEQLQAKLDMLGSQVSISTQTYTTRISVSSLSTHLPQTLGIMADVLFNPAMKQEDFDRIKAQMLEGLVYQQQQPKWMASQATRQVMFGDSVFGRSSDGTKESLTSITLDDVKSFYRKHYTPESAQVVVVGDITPEEVNKQLGFWSAWRGQNAPLIRPEAVDEVGESSLYLVDKPGAPQSIVRMVRRGLPFDATGEQFKSELANFNLAGNFNSRINQNLREDKGYTYGASGYFASNKEVGIVVFNAQVRADATLASIQELIKEMDNYSQNGITDEEIQFMRLAVGQQDALSYETPRQKAGLLASMLSNDLPADYLKEQNQLVATIDKTVLDALAAKWFDPQGYQVIVVGDAKRLEPELLKLNIPIKTLELFQ
ncbi:M16 family metallopeptidase [Vibrio hippocampi]|uniref:Peptidase M16 n=1 Tax=Vibrio hippocampi TaxID=654686 RepID=A0ABN8DFL0_9VIBR|nr:pitrilysin family protein [Vibrio hippocampi]CAH0524612.1 hypothetical protein VHP8226_00460 [Vibrio hippocampi]